jgi:dinuclear metal center YbgI/SA1388 family protein
LISHHAVIFRALRDLRTDQARGKILELLLKNDIAVYVPHTALDVVEGGLNDWLADVVGIPKDKREPVSLTGQDGQTMCALRFAQADESALLRLVERAGGQLMRRHEGCIDALVPQSRASRLVERLDKNSDGRTASWRVLTPNEPRGIGRMGRLARKTSARQLAQTLKATLEAPGVRVCCKDAEAETISKVAVLCGDGRSFIEGAIFAGVDALVTGDIDHHTGLDCIARGLTVLDVSHYASERQAGALMAGFLEERLADEPVQILVSKTCTQPFKLY